jgi:serine phosphatase RsbU (regulator of sigma subunit)
MPENPKKVFIWRSLLLVLGVAAVLVVALLFWAGINLPLNVRFPVPSPDGHYFAYFDAVRSEEMGGPTQFDLVISTKEGQLVAQFPESPGPVFWSAAGHIAVVNTEDNLASVIPDVGGQFLILAALPLKPGSLPVWSRDGTKLAYLRRSVYGEELGVYNLQQPQSTIVSFPSGFHLNQAWLLSWSPLGDEIYFLNYESDGLALEKIQIQTGELKTLVRSENAWGTPHLQVPEVSPDGSRIYLPAPAEAVIQSQTGESIWKLPENTTALWSPWSGDGLLIYRRRGLHDQVFAHDFEPPSDRRILTGFPADGVFSVNGYSYLFRQPDRRGSWNLLSPIRAWLETDWGWQQVDLRTSKAEPLGRLELWPWAETQDGLIVGRRDEYSHARFGLYDPASRDFSSFSIPTAPDDRLRQVKAQFAIWLTVGLSGLIAFAALLRRAGGQPARALAVLSFLSLLQFSIIEAMAARQTLPLAWPGTSPSDLIFELRGWLTPLDFAWLPLESLIFPLSYVSPSLFPLVLLHFVLVFPEGNQFLADRARLRRAAYAVASLPLILLIASFFDLGSLIFPPPLILAAWLIGAALAMGMTLAAILFNLHHPPDRRARNQIRWVALAFSVPLVGVALLTLLAFVGRSSGGWIGILHREISNANLVTGVLAWSCLFTLATIGYALFAQKHLDIQHLARRAARYSAMAGLVAIVFLLLLRGLGWLTAGSLGNPSNLVIVAATLLTAGILAPVRQRVESWVDRRFDRRTTEVREVLENFAEELPRILDRDTLLARLEETLRRTLECRRFFLFVLDRQMHRLRPPAAAVEIADLEFDPSEPLCRYLVERKRPLEVEVSPYNPKIVSIVRSAADRLERLGAALVFGLERRGELLGLMFVGMKESEEFFNAEDIRLLSAVARQATIAIENTGLLEEVAHDREVRKELEVASEVQARLFPVSLPRSQTCQIAGRCVPTRSVSGDYYDFLELPGNKIGLSIGDVSGKGVSASLLMASLQGLLRDQAPAADSPAELARRINRQLFSSSRGAKYCTFFYAVFDEATKQLEFVNAGHNPPLFLNPSANGAKLLESTGVPLGLFPEVTHETRSETLDPDALVVLYSDGITEARDGSGGFYGVDRLVSLVSGERHRSPEDLVDRILEDVRAFSGNAVADDDQTLVVMKVNPA